jgi:hypothetical protein
MDRYFRTTAKGAFTSIFSFGLRKRPVQKPTPFIYCGEVDFVSWEGNRPITVRWRLKEKVPRSLRSFLRVPG